MGGWVALGELIAVVGGLIAAWYFLGRGDRASAPSSDTTAAPDERISSGLGDGRPDRGD